MVLYNLPVEQMHAPVVGPLPHNHKVLNAGGCALSSGMVGGMGGGGGGNSPGGMRFACRVAQLLV